jgi:hypothetical protein
VEGGSFGGLAAPPLESSARLTRPSASALNVGYDRNNGRPGYRHVRLKPAHVRVEHTPAPLPAVVNS